MLVLSYIVAQQNAQLQQDSFRTVQLNVNTLLRMHLSPEENYCMFLGQTSELSCKG